MPSYNTDIIPSTQGISLGSPTQPWNLYARNIYLGQQVIVGSTPVTVPYANPMVIPGNGATVIDIGPLTGDVDSSTFTSNIDPGSTQFLLIRVQQDGTGGWKFYWPPNFLGTQNIDNVLITMNPGQTLNQMLLYVKDSDVAFALAPAVYYP